MAKQITKKPGGAAKKPAAKTPAKSSGKKNAKVVKPPETAKKSPKMAAKPTRSGPIKTPEKKGASVKTASPTKTTVKKLPVPTPKPSIKPVTKPLTRMTTTTKKDSSLKQSRGEIHVPGAAVVPPDYKPRDREEFMNPVMREYFRLKLLRWKAELLREAENTVHDTLQGTELQKPDLVDRASEETDHALELRTRDRERKLISKIDEALLRIEDGSYGYCEETGEPISVGRLDARPIATLSLEAQERHERKERTQRDD